MLSCFCPLGSAIAGRVKVLIERDKTVSGTPVHEVGIVNYPGAQLACILGLTDFFGIASTIALVQRCSWSKTALRVTHWKAIDSFDANL